MAERRMFAKALIDSDAFLDMPLSTQALYFHLAMRADDEGFVNNPKKIQKMIGASDDDVRILIMKRYILTFESGIIVIKHWKIHNYIQNDRFKPTSYIEEKSMLVLDEKKSYVEKTENVSTLDTQVSIGKISIDKSINNIHANSEDEVVIEDTSNKISVLKEFEIFYKLYPCSLNKSKKNSLNLYYGWLVGKQITIMGCKKTIRYNHLQLLFALKLFIKSNDNVEEQFIPRLPTFLGEKTLYDYVENSRQGYESYMLKTYGEDWQKVKFEYSNEVGA